jgi:hypothetical protein
MTQTNDARRHAIRAHMAEHSVSYTTALRHFEADDAAGAKPEAEVRGVASVYDVDSGVEAMLRPWLAEHGSDVLPLDVQAPVPAWMNVNALGGEDRALTVEWLRRGWGYSEMHPNDHGYGDDPRSTFLSYAIVEGLARTEDVTVMFFRGGGAIVIPEYAAPAVSGPPAGPRAVGYVRRWAAARKSAAAQNQADHGRFWDPAGQRIAFAPITAKERIRDYHPSMEKPSGDVLPVVTPFEDLPWLDLADLTDPEVDALNRWINGEDQRSTTYRGQRDIFKKLVDRRPSAARTFVFGEGRNTFHFGIIGLGDHGAVIVPAPLARAAHLPPLSDKFRNKGRRYGEAVHIRLHDGVYRDGRDWIGETEITVEQLNESPPSNLQSFKLLSYDPVGTHAEAAEWKKISAEGFDEDQWDEFVQPRLDAAREAAWAAVRWTPGDSVDLIPALTDVASD